MIKMLSSDEECGAVYQTESAASLLSVPEAAGSNIWVIGSCCPSLAGSDGLTITFTLNFPSSPAGL